MRMSVTISKENNRLLEDRAAITGLSKSEMINAALESWFGRTVDLKDAVREASADRNKEFIQKIDEAKNEILGAVLHHKE